MDRIDEMIESFVASLGPEASIRERHVFREALRALVRLAQAEQIASLQRDFNSVEKALSAS